MPSELPRIRERVRLPRPMAVQRVLVYHQGALGDFLLSLGAIEGLAHSLAPACFSFRGRMDHAGLIMNKPCFEGFLPGDSMELIPFFHETGWQTAPLPWDFSSADIVFIFGQPQTRPLAARLAQRLPGAVHWIQSFPPAAIKRHVSAFVQGQLLACGWSIEVAAVRLQARDEAVFRVRERLKGGSITAGQSFVVMHPGSGGTNKIWPLSRWRLFCERWIRERPERLVTVLGPADEPVREFAAEMARKADLRVIEGLSLPELAALLSLARGYVGNDSGVTHLAGAMSTPCVAVFGPTSPEVWAPLGANVRVARCDWSSADVFDVRMKRADGGEVDRVWSELCQLIG